MKEEIRRISKTLKCLGKTKNLKGDIIEIGVFKGENTFAMANYIKQNNLNKKIYACDTFVGFPYKDSIKKENGFKKGSYKRNFDNFVNSIKKLNYDNIIIPIKEKIEETLYSQLINNKFCFAFVDVDIYEPTVFAYQFLEDRIVKDGLVYFHDYGYVKTPGVKIAVDTKIDMDKFKLNCVTHKRPDTFKRR